MARVLLLTTHLNAGGIATYTVELAKALHDRGHQVFVSSSGGEWVPQMERMEIRHLRLPIDVKSELHPKVLASAMALARFTKLHQIELLHAQTRVAQVAAFSCAKLWRVPFISTCHGFFRPSPGRRMFPCWGDRVIAISDAVKEHLLRVFNVDEERIRLIYNGVDPERFTPLFDGHRQRHARVSFGLTGRPVIGTVARLVPSKGHRYLILAMAELRRRWPQAQLVIVGEGPLGGALRALASELALDASVQFLSSRLDTREILAALDLFVLPSVQEGLGLAILEAMACGLPVVAFDVGGVSSVVRHGENGLLVPAMDVKRLTQAMIEVLEDPAKAALMGTAGRRLVEERFSLHQMIDQVEALYREILP